MKLSSANEKANWTAPQKHVAVVDIVTGILYKNLQTKRSKYSVDSHSSVAVSQFRIGERGGMIYFQSKWRWG